MILLQYILAFFMLGWQQPAFPGPGPVVSTGGGAGIAFDAASSLHATTNTTTFSWSHTTGTLTNGALYVGASSYPSIVSISVTGITYNGVALTKVIRENDGTHGATVDIWRLLAPASGTHTIVVTYSSSVNLPNFGAVTLSGVNQTTPEDGAAVGSVITSGSSISNSITTTVANDWLIDTVAAVFSSSGISITPGGTQTQRWTLTAGVQEGAGSTNGPVSTGSNTMSETYGTTLNGASAQAVVAIKPQ